MLLLDEGENTKVSKEENKISPLQSTKIAAYKNKDVMNCDQYILYLCYVLMISFFGFRTSDKKDKKDKKKDRKKCVFFLIFISLSKHCLKLFCYIYIYEDLVVKLDVISFNIMKHLELLATM